MSWDGAVAVPAHPWAQGQPHLLKPNAACAAFGTIRGNFSAFPAALPVYEGAHKKVLWAIVPRGSIQEEIKLLWFLKKREQLPGMGFGAGTPEIPPI